MSRRLSFAMILGASALVWTGCDDTDESDGGMVCGGDSGVICLDDGGVDGGSGDPDAGAVDGGPISDMCQNPRGVGGTCDDNVCSSGLTCFSEFTQGLGGTFTVEQLFAIPTAVEDPENPGQYLTANDFEPGDPDTPEFVDIEIGIAPNGGLCTDACNPSSDSCPSCSTCSTAIGGSPAFSGVGIQARTFDGATPPITTEAEPGICRANCVFDAAESGCQDGYSCAVDENVCLEACVSDAQCNLQWAQTRHDGLVAVADGSATCNTTTGRCEWTPPADAAYGSECETNADCPGEVGVCLLGGRCSTYQCNLQVDGAPAYPCADDAVCVGLGGNDVTFCMTPCETPDDCLPGLACAELFDDGGSACYGICEADSECHANERCQIGGFTDPNAGTCQAYCDPTGTDPEATACGTEETCVSVDGETYGFCQPTESLCDTDASCLSGQACEVLGDDFLGQCITGCAADTDCETGEECRIQAGGAECTDDGDCGSGVCEDGTCAASTVGVCRAAGGACALSPTNADEEPILPLRGDAQCVEGQTCDSGVDMLGVCTGDVVTPDPDAGVPDDAGMADAGV